jgi:hypothetical protein
VSQADIVPEMIPHGVKACLLALSDAAWIEAAREFFLSRGFYLIQEPDPETASAKLRLNALDVVLTQDGPDFLAVAQELHGRPGLARRETCLILVGDFTSLDDFAAFAAGADFVLGKDDAARATTFLHEALRRFEDSRGMWLAT